MWLNLPLITRVTLNHVCVFVFAFSAVSLVKISEIRGLKKQLMLPRITRIYTKLCVRVFAFCAFNLVKIGEIRG